LARIQSSTLRVPLIAEIVALGRDEIERRRDEGRDSAFHVGGAASVENAVGDLGRKWRVVP
jgi:hypothetical protein